MIDALIDYGLFLAKTVTVLVGIGLLVATLMRSRRSGHSDGDQLDITCLNDRYRSMAHQLKRASLPKKDFLKLLKSDRKAQKKRAKGADSRKRMFVIDFHGDIKATEVASLREVISGVQMEAEEGDQVLVRLENAGGVVSEHGLAAAQLMRLRDRNILLTVAVDKVAASGGYLMAVVADRIAAAPFAVVGSIGVLAQLPNFHRVLEKHGVEYELHTAGDYKRTLTLFGENTEEGREKLREQLEDTHGLFKDFIRRYRPDLDLARVATGEYWHGEQALELGLIDAVETSDELLMQAAEENDLYLIAYAAHKRPLERLLSSMQAALIRVLKVP